MHCIIKLMIWHGLMRECVKWLTWDDKGMLLRTPDRLRFILVLFQVEAKSSVFVILRILSHALPPHTCFDMPESFTREGPAGCVTSLGSGMRGPLVLIRTCETWSLWGRAPFYSSLGWSQWYDSQSVVSFTIQAPALIALHLTYWHPSSHSVGNLSVHLHVVHRIE